jgi:uncharacterized protein YqgV (UPF0045/DUF77 family)
MPEHVQAGIDAVLAEGVEVEIGPLSNTMWGEADAVLKSLLAVEVAAMGAGATRIVVNVETDRLIGERSFAQALAGALGPRYRISLLDADGTVLASFGTLTGDEISRTELPLSRSSGRLRIEVDRRGEPDQGPWAVTGAVGPDSPAGSFTHVDRALEELISLAEQRIGQPLEEMSRAEKQQVVRFLDERGAFALRKSVEMVADALGVSRFTVYNYLDSTRQADGS